MYVQGWPCVTHFGPAFAPHPEAVAGASKLLGGPDLRGMLRDKVDAEVKAKVAGQLPVFKTELLKKFPNRADTTVLLSVRGKDIVVLFNVLTKPYQPPIVR